MMLLDQIILRDIDGTQNLVQQYCRKTSEAGQFNNNNDKSNYYCGYKINKYGNKQLFSVRGFVLFANISIYNYNHKCVYHVKHFIHQKYPLLFFITKYLLSTYFISMSDATGKHLSKRSML